MFTDSTKNLMLDAASAVMDTASLHTGDPGAGGTANEVTGGDYARMSIYFDPASGGEMFLSEDVTFDIPPSVTVSYVVFWDTSGSPVPRLIRQITPETFSENGGILRLRDTIRIGITDIV